MSAGLRPDGTSEVADLAEASAIHARGFYGTVEGRGLTLDRFETVYLAEARRLEVRDARDRAVAWPDLFRRAAKVDPEFGIRYVVYRDLRQRGYVARASPPPIAFAVLPRGGVLHRTPAKFWVDAQSERSPFDPARALDLTARATAARKVLYLALVDEESDLTYYRVRRSTPTGPAEPGRRPEPTIGWFSGDRVVLFEGDAVAALGDGEAYGSRIGERLELSVIEAEHLRSTGQVLLRDARSGRSVPAARFLARARRVEPGFEERLSAYRTLRARGLIPKTGFKYGAHFRVYVRAPDKVHARYLVRAARADRTLPWPEVAGGVRLAQGVRKEYLLASVPPDGGPIEFLALERIRP